MSRSAVPYDPSKIHPYAEIEKIRQTQRISAVSRVSPIIASRTSNKIAPEDDKGEVLLGNKVQALLLDCYNNVELNKNLRALLKLLTANCPKYIDGVFAGHADYNDYDFKKIGTFEYSFNKFYYEKLMSMYSRSCSNYKNINYIYSTYFDYYFKKNTNKEERNKLFKKQLLRITPMTPYIRSIINETPNGEEYSHTGGKSNKPPQQRQSSQPTKILFGKVRCIYKKSGDKKEYIKYKGLLITVKQYRDIRTRATKNRGK